MPEEKKRPVPSFDINQRRDGAVKAAMLPSSRMPDGLPDAIKHINAARDVDSYVASMRAIAGGIGSSLDEAAKALGVIPPQAFSYSTMSFMPDPANYGLMQWPGLNPESLRKVAMENIAPIIIIRQRADDLARYASVSTHPWMPGWHITMRDASVAPSAQDKKDMAEATKFILNCSMDGDRDPRDRDAHLVSPFEMFLRSFVDDTLTFDGWAVWTDMDASGKVRAFANLPAGMIRLAVPTRGLQGIREYFAALIDETGTPVKPFTREELTWRIRNVRNDPSVGPYGFPEIQMAVRLIQAFTGAIDLNASTFTNNSIPNGMLLLKGDYFNQDQIDALMREWTNMKRGMSKVWGMPVMSIPEDGDVEVLNFMDMKGQEVRYRDHMNMMMGLCCLVWRFPIRRLGMFVSGQNRDNAPTQDASIEVQGADDPGLPPLLSFVEDTINPYVLWTRWPKFALRFMSKNPKEDARQYEARRLARTWGEARAEADLQPLTKVYPSHMKELAEIMEYCPEDTVKASVYQTVAVTMLQAQLGTAGEGGGKGKTPASPGPRMENRKDPAEAQGHGHLAGTRRDSSAEKERSGNADQTGASVNHAL